MKKRLPKKKKKFPTIRYLLYVIFLIIFLGIGWQIYGGLKKSVWDGKNQINLVFATQPVAITSFSPKQESLTFLLVPNGTYLETTRGYGQYRIEAIWGLGELEGRPSFLAESCQEYLGLAIDGWVGADKEKVVLPTGEEGSEGQIKQAILDRLFGLVRKREKTNLTRWDLLRLFWQMRKVRFDKIVLIDLGKTSAVEAAVLPDETSGFKIDQVRLDGLMSRYFQDKAISEERVTLEIVNATQHPGLAAQGTRIVTSLGGRIIAVKDRDLVVDKCEVRSKKEKEESYTLEKLTRVFNCQKSDKSLVDSRAEIMLILGEGYWEKLKKK